MAVFARPSTALLAERAIPKCNAPAVLPSKADKMARASIGGQYKHKWRPLASIQQVVKVMKLLTRL